MDKILDFMSYLLSTKNKSHIELHVDTFLTFIVGFGFLSLLILFMYSILYILSAVVYFIYNVAVLNSFITLLIISVSILLAFALRYLKFSEEYKNDGLK